MAYANWFARALAIIIDALVMTVVIVLVNLSGLAAGGETATKVAVLLVFAVYGGNRWYLAGRTGQSLGRRVMGIKLVYERTQQPIGGFSAFLRDLMHGVDTILFYVGWLFPLWDAKRQTIADKISSTVVVRAGS